MKIFAAAAFSALLLFPAAALADPHPAINQLIVQQQLQQQLQSQIQSQATANQLQQMQTAAGLQTQLQQSQLNLQTLLLQQQLLLLRNANAAAARHTKQHKRKQ